VGWVRGFEVWTTPRHVLAYVLVVDALALIATGSTAALLPVTATDWIRLGILAGCVIAHIELSRSIERTRKLASGAGPFVDGLTVWHFTAVLILPAPLATALVVFTQTYVWFRVWRGRRPLYKWVFSAATVLLATQASAVLLLAAPGPHPGIPTGWIGIGFILAAALLRWLINYSLILGAILVSSPDLRAGQIVGEFGEQVLEAGAMGIGLAAAGLVEYDPRLLIGVVIGLYALHRSVLLPQFRRASQTDGKTGLYTPNWWHQIAEGAFTRAEAERTSLGVLMLDLDHFKQINDQHGHQAGDRVLQLFAELLLGSVRQGDLVGRYGGEEFCVLLPLSDLDSARAVDRRLRERLVDELNPLVGFEVNFSAGAAMLEAQRDTLEQLVSRADQALYAAKHAGRAQLVCDIARSRPQPLPAAR